MTGNPLTDTIFDWSINNLEVAAYLNGYTNVVTAVHYTYIGKFRNGPNADEYTGIITGVLYTDPPTSSTYTPYNSLTQAQIISWITAKYDMSLFNKNIIEQIQAQVTPVITVTVNLGLPWTISSDADVSGNTVIDASGNISGFDASNNLPPPPFDISGNTI